MGIYDRLFGKKKDSEKKTIKKSNKKTIKKLKPTENYKIISVELKSRGGKVSKSELKRFVNQTVFETFMSVNSHHFNTPTRTGHYGDDQYLSKGGCIKLHYFNRHTNGTPPFTIGILIYNNDTQNWESFGPRNYITGNFLVNSTDKKLFTEIKKIKSIHSRVSKITPDTIEKEKKRLEEEDKKRLEKLNNEVTTILKEFDKDGNGEVDVVEGNDFNTLLKKHQKSIVEIDRNYVQKFVKISSYLKTKKGNIQSIFNSIKDTPNQEVLNKYVEILKDDIHTYNLILFNSLNMIVSLVEDDMITFYEIYEMFDTLNIFDSKHEKDVSQKLTNIGDGLENLMYEIRDMGNQISNSIDDLSYVTEQSNEQLINQLSEIDSTMKVGNLINTINTYQNYKNNRRLNS